MNHMEHREGSRKPVDIEAIVEVGTAGTMHGRIRDVSLGGVFVKMPISLVSDYMPMRLLFTLRDHGALRRCYWRGLIVRHTEHGIGAVFESADPQDLDGLLALLDAAEHAPVTPLPLGY